MEWTLHPQFADPEPHSVQLQFGRTGLAAATDWENVGDPVVGGFYAVDSVKRGYGKFQWGHYRLVLTTPNGSYASTAQSMLGDLSNTDWRKLQAIIREESLRLRAQAGDNGWLLKRKHFGTPCSCLDVQTDEIRDPNCTLCYGTGFVGGYFAPFPCFSVETSPWRQRSHQDASRGTVNDLPVLAGRMLNVPQVFSYDVWVEQDTDNRWFIHSITAAADFNGLPLVLDPVELRLAPYSHPIYSLSVS